MDARPAGAEGEGSADARLASETNAASPKAEPGKVSSGRPTWWSTSARRQKEEASAFLVGVPQETTMGIESMVGLELVHARTLDGCIGPCLNISGNYN